MGATIARIIRGIIDALTPATAQDDEARIMQIERRAFHLRQITEHAIEQRRGLDAKIDNIVRQMASLPKAQLKREYFVRLKQLRNERIAKVREITQLEGTYGLMQTQIAGIRSIKRTRETARLLRECNEVYHEGVDPDEIEANERTIAESVNNLDDCKDNLNTYIDALPSHDEVIDGDEGGVSRQDLEMLNELVSGLDETSGITVAADTLKQFPPSSTAHSEQVVSEHKDREGVAVLERLLVSAPISSYMGGGSSGTSLYTTHQATPAFREPSQEMYDMSQFSDIL